MNRNRWFGVLGALLVLWPAACKFPANKKNWKMSEVTKQCTEGSYGYDVAFFAEKNIETIELKDEASKACILVVPGYQGRVMTSTANGNEGISYGWINHKLINSGEISSQFNPVGGEERFWLGPEGGPFSIYFRGGKEQVYSNWQVPPLLDTEPFEVISRDRAQVTFGKKGILTNASGTEFRLGIERKVSLLSSAEFASWLKVDIPGTLNGVAYQTENKIVNEGNRAWTKEGGLLSIWLLGMFNPSPTTTVFIPYRQEGDGIVVNDNYFGKVPSDRLVVEEGTIYFKIDGKYRSKIGIPPGRAMNLCGSFDSEKNILTLLWCSLPQGPAEYVNSNWGEQENPFDGDVINSYNDGPVDDGSIMGPFYEIETSSPAVELSPGEAITHTQRVAHIQGDKAELAKIVDQLFGLNLDEISSRFR